MHPSYELLARCARVTANPEHYEQLARMAHKFSAWAEMSAQAEAHGLGPLLYTHLQAIGMALPRVVKRELQGLYLRHRYANQVRTRVLAEILTAYQAAGIQAFVLKGAALAHLIYPQPGLRPMRDIDILVKKSEAWPAQHLLADLGFEAPLPAGQTLPGKHLSAASRYIDGLSITVEIHHNLFNEDFPISMAVEDLSGTPLTFSINDLTTCTLGYEDMLWHLCQHFSLMGQPLRLIWVADIAGFAERFAAEIDWARLERQYPLVLSTLSLLHFITPLSPALLEQIPLKIGPAPPGVGLEFQGWPRSSLSAQQFKGYRQILRDTFYPPEWWLRLYYGLGAVRSSFWYRWLIHPWRILSWAGQVGRASASQRSPDQR